MKAVELKKRYIRFFEKKNHKFIPSSSLIPENDPTVLFTTAGMHPLVPFLLGQKHPSGKRIVDVQKCLRTDDINDVGDSFHNTFFEMLGNWSLGDYFKKEAIEWSFEFMTSKKWLGIDKEKISVTVFSGDSNASRDDESAKIWISLGIPKERIHYLSKKDNWWGPSGSTGPCGPCTEMFFNTGKKKCSKDCKPGCNCGKYCEIWNDVFMEYNKTKNGRYELLKQKNVDTGMGLERTTAVLQGKENVYETELFLPILRKIRELSKSHDVKSERIIADHIRAVVFVLGDNRAITPSNLGHGYIVRRLLRRAIRHSMQLQMKDNVMNEIAGTIIDIYSRDYDELKKNRNFIIDEINKEEERFKKTIDIGMKHFSRIETKNKTVSGKDAFLLFQSYGFPIEMTEELAAEKGWKVDMSGFENEFEKHQELSRKSMEGVFKSGLADHSDISVKYHTATHLLHQALRTVLGDHVKQKGSNITAERLRFDFSHTEKMTQEQIKKVEDIVNQKIGEGLIIHRVEMSPNEAKKRGALGFFESKYGESVSVYIIGGFSKEICAGPHVKNTKELRRFKIVKEESVSAGVRRIKAILE
ncbi:MAG: alanine--tRNA ligase [Candidatus Aenigmatarchaeota archaeon]